MVRLTPLRFFHLNFARLLSCLIATLVLCLAWGWQAGNPQVPNGGSATFASTGTEAPASGAWDILNPAGIQIAHSGTPAGWTVTLSGSSFTVGAPASASVGASYKVRHSGGMIVVDPNKAFQALQGVPPALPTKSAFFDVVTPSPPATPTGLDAVGGTSKVTLTWVASSGATGYKLKRATTAGGSYTTVASNIATPYVNVGLTDGTRYYYVVSATNATGESGDSNEASATPIALPANLTATPGNSEVSLTWSSAIGATGYKIKYGTSPGVYSNVLTTTGTAHTLMGLSNGATYYFVVSGTNTVGESGNSTSVSAQPVGPPSAPTGVTGVAGTSRAILSWTAVPGATSYQISYGVSSGNYSNTTTASGFPRIVSGLTNGTKYYFVVRGVAGGLESGNSVEVNATPIAVPTGLSATGGNGQVALNWSAAAGAPAYKVKYGTAAGSYPNSVVAAGTSAVVTGLANGTTYYFVVTGTNTVGESDPSASASAIPALAPPMAPANFTAVGGTAKATLSWSASAGATSYKILRGTTPGSYVDTVVANYSGTSYVDGGRTNGTAYYYVVQAANSMGSSPNSIEGAATPIAIPGTFIATGGDGQIDLDWTSVLGATGYSVKTSSSYSGPFTTIATNISATNYTVTGLVNNTAYYFVVTGTNTVGESSPSSVAGAAPGVAPATPTNFNLTIEQLSLFKMTWTPSAGAEKYEVWSSPDGTTWT
ncbi:MAG: hypothetical protein EOP84_11555, partial [Verrucomicrobiaceae bacterium]